MALMAVGYTAKNIYDTEMAEGEEMMAEKMIRTMQELLEPTAATWDFSKLEAMRNETEND